MICFSLLFLSFIGNIINWTPFSTFSGAYYAIIISEAPLILDEHVLLSISSLSHGPHNVGHLISRVLAIPDGPPHLCLYLAFIVINKVAREAALGLPRSNHIWVWIVFGRWSGNYENS